MGIVLLAVFLISCTSQNSLQSSTPTPPTWATKSSPGEVMVDLTPTAFENGKLRVDMTVTTHSVNDLNTYDLTKITRLTANGKEYRPITAPTLAGHHATGELGFQLEQLPPEFTITIENLHDPGTREFVWLGER